MDIRSLFGIDLRVLVVDRDDSLRDLVEKLESFHYEVIACSEAASALNILKLAKERIDLIITEVKLPKLDGFSFLNIVKELNIPVIMISCSPQHELAIKCLAAGATFYYRKPLEIESVSGMWRHIPLRRIFTSSMRVTKIKEQKLDEEENSDRQGNEGDGERKKVTWTNEMHLEFIHAVDILGVTKATPVKVLELLDRKGLEKKHVASHLQKYRDHMKGKQRDTYKRNILWSGETMYEKPSIFDSGPKEMIDRHKAELRMEENIEDSNISAQEEDCFQTLPEACRDHKKRKREETQKSIKLTVGDTVHERSSTIDPKPEDMANNNVSETFMIDNETTPTTSVSPTNDAGTQVEMYCDQRQDNNSDGHKRSQKSIEETIFEKPFVSAAETEDVINTDMVKMWGVGNGLVPNINAPQACESDNQSAEINCTGTTFDLQTRMLPQEMTEYSSEFDTLLDVDRLRSTEGYSLTHGYHDSNPVENFSDYTDLMSYDRVEKILWTGQGTEVIDEHILPQYPTSGNSDVPLQHHNDIEPDDNVHSMPEQRSSVNVNEQQALKGIENLPIFSDNGANHEYNNASGADEENLELPDEISLDTFWGTVFDEKDHRGEPGCFRKGAARSRHRKCRKYMYVLH